MGLIRFLIFVGIFYLVYHLVRNVLLRPFREGYANGGQRSRGGFNPFQRKDEGDVSVEYDPRKDKKPHHEIGEYVDYEEVKEDK